MKKALFILLVFIASLQMSLAQARWTVSMYSQHNFESFGKLPMANSEIDFNHIDYTLLNAAIFYATNRMRVRYNKKPFVYDANLEKAAVFHSNSMVKYDFFSHTGVENGYKSMMDRMRAFKVTGRSYAENIASTFGIQYRAGSSFRPPRGANTQFIDARTNKPIPVHTYLSFAVALVQQWMESPGHKQNILNSSYTKLGCGAAFYRDGSFSMPYFKCTQNFAG
ncbi:MAG: CAP domain-containing protein [Bernardetiaceae bacterium]|nr:CAP domain-containing protein [Bernardetiaceae bacterium]